MKDLVFYVNKKLTQRSDHPNSIKLPGEYPCFVLVFNYNWDDCGYCTWFCLYYMPSADTKLKIGELKLMKRGEANTFNSLPSRFEGPLDDTYCSIGISTSFYKNIRSTIDDEGLRKRLLESLRDCVYNYHIREDFHDDDIFNASLMADMSTREALRIGEFILTNEDYRSAFKFCYKYIPKYDTRKEMFANFEVNFDFDCPEYMRSVALVGENGVGKTQLLCGLVKDLLTKETNTCLSKKPKFHSCLAICSSLRDGFMDISTESTSIDYYRCCLSMEKEQTYATMKEALYEILKRPLLFNKSMTDVYNSNVSRFLKGQFERQLLEFNTEHHVVVNEALLRHLVEILSSGHLQMLELLTYLCAYIHISSLVVIDELEVHLHPHFIMRYMPLLNSILGQFQAYAILSTHSPLVVRECVNSNVYRFTEGEGRQPLIGPVCFRTFGEDVTNLFRNIFGYDEKESYFTEIVNRLIEKEIHEDLVENDEDVLYKYVIGKLGNNMELGLSSMMAIQNIIRQYLSNNSHDSLKNEEL